MTYLMGLPLHRYSILGLYAARIFTKTEEETIDAQQKHKDLLALQQVGDQLHAHVSAHARAAVALGR